ETLGLKSTQVQIDVQSDAAVSGEVISRPGIDAVREKIGTGQIDWLVTEGASRFFRAEGACFDLVGVAVDADIRVICINDRIDTFDGEDWQSRLLDAVGHHAKTNRHTKMMIRRAHHALHEMGAALGHVKPGYTRTPTYPATDREPARGPFFDQVDEKWREVIIGAFERIASGHPAWVVAEWLDQKGLPKTANAQREDWTPSTVNSMIRNPIYIGKGRFRVTVTKKVHSTGKSKQVRNDEDDILISELPHLRIVSDFLFNAANETIDERCTRSENPRGKDHPLAGVPRDSRGALTQLLLCDICGEPMHINGRREGAYRCRCLTYKHQLCWNRATAERQLAHSRIGNGIADELIKFLPHVEELIERARSGLDNTDGIGARLAVLNAEVESQTAERDRYVLAIGAGENGEIPQLAEKVKERNRKIAECEADVERLRFEAETVVVPSADAVRQEIIERCERIREMTRESRADLIGVVDEIRAIPHQQFDSNLVVLRAEIKLNLVGLLPWSVRSFIESIESTNNGDFWLAELRRTVTVDLFEPSNSPRYAMEVLRLRDDGGKYPAIAKQLDITEMAVKRAIALGRKMTAAGLTDPYVRLTEEPRNASRWRPDGRNGERAIGGDSADAA
ncbi:MAG: site-specific DNA recombinase, partial [Planctomycetaceae bacterium]